MVLTRPRYSSSSPQSIHFSTSSLRCSSLRLYLTVTRAWRRCWLWPGDCGPPQTRFTRRPTRWAAIRSLRTRPESQVKRFRFLKTTKIEMRDFDQRDSNNDTITTTIIMKFLFWEELWALFEKQVKIYNRRKTESRLLVWRVPTERDGAGRGHRYCCIQVQSGFLSAEIQVVCAQWCSWVLLTDINIELRIKLFRIIKDRSSPTNKQIK